MSTKKLPTLKEKPQYPTVIFTVDGWNGEFVLPDLRSLSVKVQRHLSKGELDEFIEFLDEHAPDYVPIIDGLNQFQLDPVLTAWSKASNVDTGKFQG